MKTRDRIGGIRIRYMQTFPVFVIDHIIENLRIYHLKSIKLNESREIVGKDVMLPIIVNKRLIKFTATKLKYT